MSDRVPMTRRGYQMLQEQLKRLKSTDRPRIVREIEAARAHGDISENAEYHAAKERQGHIEAQIAQIDDALARAQVIDPGDQGTERVRFGLTVVLEDGESGERHTFTIVGEHEADAASGRISVTSPIARALLGKEAEASVTVHVPRGTREFEILEIRLD